MSGVTQNTVSHITSPLRPCWHSCGLDMRDCWTTGAASVFLSLSPASSSGTRSRTGYFSQFGKVDRFLEHGGLCQMKLIDDHQWLFSSHTVWCIHLLQCPTTPSLESLTFHSILSKSHRDAWTSPKNWTLVASVWNMQLPWLQQYGSWLVKCVLLTNALERSILSAEWYIVCIVYKLHSI